MIRDFSLQEAIHQIRECHESMREVFPFMKKNKLWKGLRQHKWISIISVVLSLLIAYMLVSNFIEAFSSETLENGSLNINLGEGIDEANVDKAKAIGKKAIMSGGWKKLFLILSEVIIFYFATKALAILKDIKINPTFKQFVNAQKRMLLVMVRNFIKAVIISIPIHILLGIFSLKEYADYIMFFVYAYYIGLAFLDNYSEQFEIPISQSCKSIYEHRYAATFLGVVISGLLYVPLIGALITPLFGAITATIYGHKNSLEYFGEEEIF